MPTSGNTVQIHDEVVVRYRLYTYILWFTHQWLNGDSICIHYRTWKMFSDCDANNLDAEHSKSTFKTYVFTYEFAHSIAFSKSIIRIFSFSLIYLRCGITNSDCAHRGSQKILSMTAMDRKFIWWIHFQKVNRMRIRLIVLIPSLNL